MPLKKSIRGIDIEEYIKHTLSSVSHPEIRQSEFLDVLFQGYTLGTRVGLSDKGFYGLEVFA